MSKTEILAALRVRNTERCETPLEDDDVAVIAHDIGNKPSGGPYALSQVAIVPWPTPMPAEAYYGIAGEIVRAIEPHSEADPAALIVQLLVGFGSITGRTAPSIIESDMHFLNENAVLVGDTAAGRKGISWGNAESFLR